MKSEIRKDYLQDNYSLIAPRRAKRFAAENKACPFCLDNTPKGQVIVPFTAKNKTAVLKNLYPAVTPDNRKAYGRQEIIVDTPDHGKRLHELSVEDIAELIKTYGERLDAMKRDAKIKHVLIFKNSGHNSGATLPHEHSQVFGTEFVPPYLLDKRSAEERYKSQKGSCPYCDIAKKESKGPRKIFADKNVAVFAPYASRNAYEVEIVPFRHIDNVSRLSLAERTSVAKALKAVLGAISELKVAYNFYMHELVDDAGQHLYIKIAPRGAILGAVEIGMGLIVNPVAPEEAAKFYRKFF